MAAKNITVNWINGDSSIMKTEIVEEGSAATPPEEEPTKPETDKYTYSFSGWDLDYSSITSDMANNGEDTVNILSRFYANKKQDPEVTTFTVNWYNGDRSLMKTEKVADGSAATPPTSTPTKAATSSYKYSFAGWDVDYRSITADSVNSGKSTVNINSKFKAIKLDPDDPTTEDKTTEKTTEDKTTEKTTEQTTEDKTTEQKTTTEQNKPGDQGGKKQGDSASDVSKQPATYTYMGSGSPKTGDAAPVALAIAIMGISGVGIVILSAKKRKKDEM